MLHFRHIYWISCEDQMLLMQQNIVAGWNTGTGRTLPIAIVELGRTRFRSWHISSCSNDVQYRTIYIIKGMNVFIWNDYNLAPSHTITCHDLKRALRFCYFVWGVVHLALCNDLFDEILIWATTSENSTLLLFSYSQPSLWPFVYFSQFVRNCAFLFW